MRSNACTHERVRGIYGDEILHRMKVYLRWWKDPVIYRAACLDCGGSLDGGLPIPDATR